MASILVDTSSLTSLIVTTSTEPAVTPSQTTTETPVAINNESKSLDTSRKGLSKEAKVGLGVGLGLAIPLLFLLVAALLFFRRRRRQQQEQRAQVDSKYEAQAQSELSMVEPSYPFPAGPPRPDVPMNPSTRHSQAYLDLPPQPQVFLDDPVSAVTQKEAFEYPRRRSTQPSLTLQIPDPEEDSLRSRDVSPIHDGSPVSPISPDCTAREVGDRSPSPSPKTS